MKPVLTKADFVERYTKGEFGNCSPTWNSLNEFLQSDYNGLVHIRNRVAGGLTFYNVSAERVPIVWHEITENGYVHISGPYDLGRRAAPLPPESLYISAMCPTELTTIQGEVVQSDNYIDLTYSTVAKPMRAALAERAEFCNGIRAVGLLKWGMDPASYDWLQELLILYPFHVVEFTCLKGCWGTVPNRNTLFWEVRNY